MTKGLIAFISFLAVLGIYAGMASWLDDGEAPATDGNIVIGLSFEGQTAGRDRIRLFTVREFDPETGRAFAGQPLLLSRSIQRPVIAAGSRLSLPEDVTIVPSTRVRIERHDQLNIHHVVLRLPKGHYYIEAARADGESQLQRGGTVGFEVEGGKTFYLGDYIYHRKLLPQGHNIGAMGSSVAQVPDLVLRPELMRPALVRFDCEDQSSDRSWIAVCRADTVRVRVDEAQRKGKLVK